MIIFFVDQNHKNKTLSEILDIQKLKDDLKAKKLDLKKMRKSLK